MIGSQISPCVLFIRIVPTIGPVQEKETSTRVRAIKKTPKRPPFSDLASALFTKDVGITISNAPKKEAAKIINIIKKSRLGIQCVASQLKMKTMPESPPAK